MKHSWNPGAYITLAMLILAIHTTVLKTPIKNKEKLRKAALKESHREARELMVIGVHSLSARKDSGWGAKALNRAFSKAFNLGSIASGSKDFKSGQNQGMIGDTRAKFIRHQSEAVSHRFDSGLSLLKMSDVLYDFMDRHGIFVKAQGDSSSHIRYSLYTKRNKDMPFDVKLSNQKGSYSIEFKSNSPYLERKSPLTGEMNVTDQVNNFLEKNFADWKKLRWSRRLNMKTDKKNKKKKKLKKKGKQRTLNVVRKKKNLKQSIIKKENGKLTVVDNKNAEKPEKLAKPIPSRNKNDRPAAKDLRNAELLARKAIFSPSPMIPNFQKNNIPNNNKTTTKLAAKPVPVPKLYLPVEKDNAPVKTNSVKFVDDLDAGKERKLSSLDEIVDQSIKGAVAQIEGVKSTSEDINKWEVSLDSTGPHNNARICSIALVQLDTISILEMDNQLIPAMATRHRLSRRHISASEDANDLQEYIHAQIAGFVDDYVTLAQQQTDLNKLAEILTQEVFEPRGEQLIRTDEVDVHAGDPTFLVLNHVKDSTSNKIETQIRLFRVNSEFNQMQISHKQRTVELQVPTLLAMAQKDNLIQEINNILTNEEHNAMVDYEEALKIITNTLSSTNNCSSINPQNDGSGTTVLEIGEGCAFENMSFVITNFDYGYLQYIHLLLDNQYFQSEHLIAYTMATDFHSNIENVLRDMESTIEDVKKAQDSNSEDITLEHITQMVKEVLGNQVEESATEASNETVFKRAGLNDKRITTIRILEIKGDEETTSMFRVFLFDPKTHSHHFSRSKSQHEYVLYANNGLDELNILKKDLEKLKLKLEEIRKRRKKKAKKD